MKKFRTAMVAFAAVGALMVGIGAASAQQQLPDIKIEELRDGLYVIYGGGGNIGMSAGEEGVFLIDDQYAPLTKSILAAIAKINDGEVHFLINTHHHGDHTGGNENFGEMGTLIIAHDNVRARLVAGDRPGAAIPVITFNDQASIFINGKEARAIHFENAHTDGDSVIYFEAQNLIHMGDIFFRARFPFIDVNSGGGVNGMIHAVTTMIAMSNDDTIIIPGHGQVGGKADLVDYLTMLTTIRDRVQALIDEGASLEEVLAAKPTEDHDHLSWNFISPERMVTAVYRSLTE
ncbi:MAG: MBL fold metallo-hydrolase [Sphingomonadales bacterium]